LQGKSTIALNLAAAAAREGDRVVLVDADKEGSVATLEAEAAEKPGLADVIVGRAPSKAVLLPFTAAQIDLLPSGNLSGLRAGRAETERLGAALIDQLAEYDVIVVDGCAAGPDRVTSALVARADACFVVAQKDRATRAATAGMITRILHQA
jgi:cellulose biosynthesis protein BcsQ